MSTPSLAAARSVVPSVPRSDLRFLGAGDHVGDGVGGDEAGHGLHCGVRQEGGGVRREGGGCGPGDAAARRRAHLPRQPPQTPVRTAILTPLPTSPPASSDMHMPTSAVCPEGVLEQRMRMRMRALSMERRIAFHAGLVRAFVNWVGVQACVSGIEKQKSTSWDLGGCFDSRLVARESGTVESLRCVVAFLNLLVGA